MSSIKAVDSSLRQVNCEITEGDNQAQDEIKQDFQEKQGSQEYLKSKMKESELEDANNNLDEESKDSGDQIQQKNIADAQQNNMYSAIENKENLEQKQFEATEQLKQQQNEIQDIFQSDKQQQQTQLQEEQIQDQQIWLMTKIEPNLNENDQNCKNQQNFNENEQKEDNNAHQQNEKNDSSEQKISSCEDIQIELIEEQTSNQEIKLKQQLESHNIEQQVYLSQRQNQNENKSNQSSNQALNCEEPQINNYEIEEQKNQSNTTTQQEAIEDQIIDKKCQIFQNLYQEIIQDNYTNLIQQDPLYHQLQESKSVEDLKVLLDDQLNNSENKSENIKKAYLQKKLVQRSELSNFLKKHDLASSNSLSEQEDQIKKIKQKGNSKKPSNVTVKKQKPTLIPVKKVEEKKQIYRFCRDPYNQRYSQKIQPKRKFFCILDLDLKRYSFGLICSFLEDQQILKLRLVSKRFSPFLLEYFHQEKKQTILKIINQKKSEILEIKNTINKAQFYKQKIKNLTEQIINYVSHVHVYLYFDKLDVKTLSINEGKLIKLFYEALLTKPSLINSLKILKYSAQKEEITTLFGNLTLSYDFMNQKLQQQFYYELQLIVDFIKMNNGVIFPFILETQIFTFSQEMIKQIESNMYIEKTYSSKILKGIYYWFELQLFYNQFCEKESTFQQLYDSQEQINYLIHSYEINHYLLSKNI